MAWYECTGGSGGGGTVTIPQLIGLVVGNRSSDASISYTFTGSCDSGILDSCLH